MDQGAAKLPTGMESMPEELESLERRILQLEIEREALRKEKDQASKERLNALEKELANLKGDRDARKAQWEGEKHAIDDIQKLRTALELARTEMEQVQRRGDLTRVAEYKYGKIPQLEQRLKEHEAKVSGDRTKRRLLQEEVTADEVAEVVSRWTGIPVSRLLEGEKEKLLRLDQILHERVVGQDEAVQRPVDFKNTIIIMTSNVGSPYLIENASERGEIAEHVRSKVMGELRVHFRPEFLNRVDEIVLFNPLTLSEIERIIDLQLKLLRVRLSERHLELELTKAAKEYIAREGYDPVYGARPLKRYLQRHLETALSRQILAGTIPENSRVTVDCKKGQLTFESVPLSKDEGADA